MKFKLQGSVTIPKRPSSVGGIIGWARGVNRTLQELRDRKVVGIVSRSKTGQTPFPFQVTASSTLLKSAPGLLGGTSILSQEEENPADDTWYLVAKVVISSTTGVISSKTVFWTTTSPVDTTTDFHIIIAEVTILLDEIDVLQYTFGPISVVVGGGSENIWAVRIL